MSFEMSIYVTEINPQEGTHLLSEAPLDWEKVTAGCYSNYNLIWGSASCLKGLRDCFRSLNCDPAPWRRPPPLGLSRHCGFHETVFR